MNYIFGAKEMQQIDNYAIHTIGIPGMVLMERAALAVTNVIRKSAKAGDKCLIVVECGNNGGDGAAAARQLLELEYEVTLYVLGDMKRASDSFLQQYKIYNNLGGTIITKGGFDEYDVIVDGIFGVGLGRDITGIHAQAIEAMNKAKALKIAIDMPTGIDATSGHIRGTAFKADITVTFGYNKIGLILYPGASYAGNVEIVNIGFPKSVLQQSIPTCVTYTKEDLSQLPKRTPYSNKGTYGKILIVAGSKNMAGAAYLSGKAAYITGAGLVKICTHESNRIIIQNLLPEAVLITYETEEEAKSRVREGISWADSIVYGPGMGQTTITSILLETLIEESDKPLVLDADSLNVLARDKNILFHRKSPIVITPHLKEMARLMDTKVDEIKNNLIQVASYFASQYEVICVLKDARTIVAEAEFHTYINTSGNSGMATGGSGDVLTGIIASYIGQGLDCGSAARLAVYCHGLSGDKAKEEKGEYCLLAQDLIHYMNRVLGEPKNNDMDMLSNID